MFSKLLIYHKPHRIITKSTPTKKDEPSPPSKPKPSATNALHFELLVMDQEVRWMPSTM
jgi:hypothetical protein